MFTETQTRERWIFKDIDELKVREIAEALDIEFTLAKILLVRNIGNGDIDKIKAFLYPDKKLLYQTDAITTPDNLSKALTRLSKAIDQKETIMINGDPDADGITGTTILVAGLTELGARVEYDFPIRSKEGHGLQVRIIEKSKSIGASLIITTDCGSKDTEAVEYAIAQGMDVIITDHHIIGKNIPKALAIVNPQLVSGPSPFKKLAGAGVAFKTIQALYEFRNTPLPQDFLEYLLSIAMLGTLSDRMSMLEPVNRLMVDLGIESLRNTRYEGLKSLKKICLEDSEMIMARHLSRTIIPRLNAPGRIGDPEKGIPDSTLVVDLLLIGTGRENVEKADALAERLSNMNDNLENKAFGAAADVDEVNEQRKYLTNKIEEEIEVLIKTQVNPETDKVIIIKGENWNSGVIGIDTDRLKERFLRPAIILTQSNDEDYVRGSVRSIPLIDMYSILDEVDSAFQEKYGRNLFQMRVRSASGDKFVNAFGGHAQACGFTMHVEDIETFKTLVHQRMDQLPMESFEYAYHIIDQIPFTQLTKRFINRLDQLGPYGQSFEYPIFYLKGCMLSRGRSFGNKYQELRKPHVKFIVSEPLKKGRLNPMYEFKAVGFGLYEKFTNFKAQEDEHTQYDVIFTVEKLPKKHIGRSGTAVRLNVLDIRLNSQAS